MTSDAIRLWLLTRLGRRLVPEYRFRWPDLDWVTDSDFTDYLKRFDEFEGYNADRRWALYQLAQVVGHVSGDTVECGAYKGSSSYLIASRISTLAADKRHHIFDSFEGLSDPSPVDGAHWTRGDLTATEEELRSNLAEFSGIIDVHPGWIPEVFSAHRDSRFSFAHIDVDLYEPTLASLEFIFPRLSPGGVLLCDDYGFRTCPGATAAMREYFEGSEYPIVGLASGGSFVIKQ
ncbi:MAG TPA: TylF/MycF/NovP-related O-methyltransferase [Ilumatobacter sp.]|nr:TylF/MycF/NovP-related O-methyltransferase [Ilumatobacter sp.]